MKYSTNIKAIFKNSLLLFSGESLALILNVLSLVVLANAIDQTLLGIYILFITYTQILDGIFNFQTWKAFIKYSLEYKDSGINNYIPMLIKYTITIDICSLTLCLLISLFLSYPFMILFSIPFDYYHLLILLCFGVLFKTAEISTGIFRTFDNFAVSAQITVFSSAVKLTLFALIFVMNPSFTLFVYATLFTMVIAMATKFFFMTNTLNRNGVNIVKIIKTPINFQITKKHKILPFIFYTNLDSTVKTTARQLDVLIIGKFYGPELAAVYKIAKEIAFSIAKITDSAYHAIYPEYSKLVAKKDYIGLKSISTKVITFNFIIGLTFYLFFLLLGQQAIRLIFGDGFDEAYSIAAIYFIATWIATVTGPLYPLLWAFSYSKQVFRNQIHTAALYTPILITLTIFFSGAGAALANIFYFSYIALLTTKSLKKAYHSHGTLSHQT